MLGRFSEDLTALQRAIRFGDGDTLHKLFVEARATRRGIIEAGQDTAAPDFGRHGARPNLRAHDRIGHDLWVFAYGSLMWRPGFAVEETRTRQPDGLPALLLHLLGLSSRHARAARHGAGAGPRRRCEGIAYRVAAANVDQTHALSAGARADQRRLSRGDAAGGAEGEPRAEVMALTYIVERAHPELCRPATARKAGAADPGAQRHFRRQPRLPGQHAAAPAGARHPRARAGAAADHDRAAGVAAFPRAAHQSLCGGRGAGATVAASAGAATCPQG